MGGTVSERTGGSQQVPTAEQVSAILAGLPDHLVLPVALIAACGLRVGELLALERGDILVGEDGMWLCIERSLMKRPGSDTGVGPVKRGGPFEVPVPEPLAERLRRHLTAQDGQPDDPLFTTPKGDTWQTTTFTRAYSKATAGSPSSNVSLHMLRHAVVG